MAGVLAPNARPPVKPKAPATTSINGQTYVYNGQKPSPATGPYSMGNQLEGPNGALWNPMDKPMAAPAAGGGPRPANGPGPGPAKSPGPAFDPYAALMKATSLFPNTSPRVADMPMPDRTAAEAATFGRAKDRVGRATQGLLKSVRNQFSSRGLSGSSLEGDQIGGALMAGHGQLGDTIRDQAIEGLNRSYDVLDKNYQGNIAQRGQDLSQEAQRRESILALVRLAQQSAGAY
jgi:hypothetical protein